MSKSVTEQARTHAIQGDYKKALELLESMLKSKDIRKKIRGRVSERVYFMDERGV